MTEDMFMALLRALFETFGVQPTQGQILGYRMALDGLDVADVEQGIGRAIRELKFMPKPAELRELAGVMPAPTRAILAWGAVKKAVHALSAYGSPDFDDPVINATTRNMGGWVRLCGRDASEFDTWVRKDFERIYVSMLTGGVLPGELMRPLAGIHEGETQKVVTGLPVESQRQLRAVNS